MTKAGLHTISLTASLLKKVPGPPQGSPSTTLFFVPKLEATTADSQLHGAGAGINANFRFLQLTAQFELFQKPVSCEFPLLWLLLKEENKK